MTVHKMTNVQKHLVLTNYDELLHKLEFVILATPTGPERELLTGANIDINEAKRQFTQRTKE